MITILIAALAASSAIFSALYFQSKKNSERLESKAEALSSENNDLKCEIVRLEEGSDDSMNPLTTENIVDFLKYEVGTDVEVLDEMEMINFKVGNYTYNIDCSRLPQQFVIRTAFRTEGSNVNWDAFKRAAQEVMSELVMVKAFVDVDEGFDFTIVSTTHTVAALRADYYFFISLLQDAARALNFAYGQIMEQDYPDEFASLQDVNAAENIEDLAVRMGEMAAGQPKVIS